MSSSKIHFASKLIKLVSFVSGRATDIRDEYLIYQVDDGRPLMICGIQLLDSLSLLLLTEDKGKPAPYWRQKYPKNTGPR